MRIFIHGNDRGNALLISLITILILSTLFVSMAPQISAARQLADKTKSKIINEIEESNREILNQYDLY